MQGNRMLHGPWAVLAVLGVVRIAMGFQFQSIASVAPLLVPDLGVTYATLGSLVGAYLLPGVVVALPGGWLSGRLGDWRVALIALVLMALGTTAVMAVLGLLLILAAPRGPPAAAPAIPGAAGLASAALPAVVIAGLMWALFNAGLVVLLAFAPGHLVARGYSMAVAGGITSALSWATIPALTLGGYLVARLDRPGLALVGCCLATAALGGCLPYLPAPLLLCAALGLLFGPPGGLILLLPAEVLRPSDRALGMGVFYTVYYAGMACLPALAGLARDLTGTPAAPLDMAAVFMTATAACLPAFRAMQRRFRPNAPGGALESPLPQAPRGIDRPSHLR